MIYKNFFSVTRVAIKEASFLQYRFSFSSFPSETYNINQEYANVCLQERYKSSTCRYNKLVLKILCLDGRREKVAFDKVIACFAM